MADQLGHADPALTLRVYAHALREEETDLSFADFGGPRRQYTAPTRITAVGRSRKPAKRVVTRARFARSATPTWGGIARTGANPAPSATAENPGGREG